MNQTRVCGNVFNPNRELSLWLLVLVSASMAGCTGLIPTPTDIPTPDIFTPEPVPVEWKVTLEDVPPEDSRLRPVYKHMGNPGFRPTVDELLTPQMQQLFPATAFYLPRSSSTEPSYFNIIAVRRGQVYELPGEFNRLLADAGVQVTEANRACVARAFIWATQDGRLEGGILRFEEEEVINETDLQVLEFRYQLQIQSWVRGGGERRGWKIGFRENSIQTVMYTVMPYEGGIVTRSWVEGGFEQAGETEYLLCCDEKGLFMSSWGPSMSNHPFVKIPIDFQVKESYRGDWSRGLTEVEISRLIEKAPQGYAGNAIDKNWMFREGSHAAIKKLFGQELGLYLVAPPVTEQVAAPVLYPGLLAVWGKKGYALPKGFNLLLNDTGVQVADANQADVARAFIAAAHQELLSDLLMTAPRLTDEVDPNFPAYHYQLEIQSWVKERGVAVEWKFGFQDGQITVVQAVVLGRFTGDWESHLSPNVMDPFFQLEKRYYICCDEEGGLR